MKNVTDKIALGVAAFVFLMGIICIVVCLALFSNRVDTDGIPQLDSVYATEEVEGSTREQLIAKWGSPDGKLSGFYGDVWQVNGNDELIAYYGNDDTVQEIKYIHNMRAEIVEVNSTSLLLKPCAGEAELNSSDLITVGYSGLAESGDISQDIVEQFKKGAVVIVGYDGMIAETYPAQITAKYGINIAATAERK